MRKILVTVIILAILLLPTITVVALDDEVSMVYASGLKQETIYQMLQCESFDYYKAFGLDSLSVVKESITPVYTIDLLEYAQTDKLVIKPLISGHKSTDGQCNTYVAKTITSNNEYGGNIMFYIENGVAHSLLFSPSIILEQYYQLDGSNQYMASCSYADHAKRIQLSLNKNSFVSVYDVKYVVIDMLGSFFYINDNGNEVLVPVGYLNTGFSYSNDVVINIDCDIKNIADKQFEDYIQYLKEKNEWEMLNPGKAYSVTGYGAIQPLISGCSQVDNILNISEFLNIDLSAKDYTDNCQLNDEYTRGETFDWQFYAMNIFIILFSCAMIFIWYKRINKHTTIKSYQE